MKEIRKRLTTTALDLRLRRHLESKNLLMIRRSRCALGPLLVLDLNSGELVQRNVKTLAELAKLYGLIQSWETAS